MKKSGLFIIALISLSLGVSCGKSEKAPAVNNTSVNTSTSFAASNATVTGGSTITEFRAKINSNEIKTFQFNQQSYYASEVYVLYCSEEIRKFCKGNDIKERSLSNDGTVRNNPFGSSRDEIKARVLSIIDNRTRSHRISNTKYSIKVAGNGGEDEYIIDISIPFFLNPIYARLSNARDSYIPNGSQLRFK